MARQAQRGISIHVFGKQRTIRHCSWEHLALGIILTLSAGLNFFHLDQLGYGNVYYAAAVKSMLQSWHNFFFVAFDPENFVTVDKPPVGLWIQVASAKLFGFSGFSLLLPQALAGVLAVALLYYLVRRSFGRVAGVFASLALALTPISVATNRNNTIDSLLVLTLLLATWALFCALESGRLRWLFLCALLVGVGFNIKMLQAYLVLPAFSMVYLLGAPKRYWVRGLHLFLAFFVLLMISLSWIVAVDLVPANERPYVGSSQTNSELELAFGYNGLIRLLGVGVSQSAPTQGKSPMQKLVTAFVGSDETGSPGPFRLFNQQLGAQLSWLLPLAIIGLCVAGWQTKRSYPPTRKQQALLLWGIWLFTTGSFFSVAGLFHPYYLVMVAPALSALVGIGVVALWQEYQRKDWRTYLLPGALLLTGAVQVVLLIPYASYSNVLAPIIIGLAILAVLLLILGRWVIGIGGATRILLTSGSGIGLLALFLAPACWSMISLLHTGNALLPEAGPLPRTSQALVLTPDEEKSIGQDNVNQKLIQYLQGHEGKTVFLVATLDALTAAPIMLASGKPVMALGGFLGIDPIVTPQNLSLLVADGKVQYFLLPYFQLSQLPVQIQRAIAKKEFAGFGIAHSLVAILSWANTNCVPVPDPLWRIQSTPLSVAPTGGVAEASPQDEFTFAGATERLYSCHQ